MKNINLNFFYIYYTKDVILYQRITTCKKRYSQCRVYEGFGLGVSVLMMVGVGRRVEGGGGTQWMSLFPGPSY